MQTSVYWICHCSLYNGHVDWIISKINVNFINKVTLPPECLKRRSSSLKLILTYYRKTYSTHQWTIVQKLTSHVSPYCCSPSVMRVSVALQLLTWLIELLATLDMKSAFCGVVHIDVQVYPLIRLRHVVLTTRLVALRICRFYSSK